MANPRPPVLPPSRPGSNPLQPSPLVGFFDERSGEFKLTPEKQREIREENLRRIAAYKGK